MTLRDIRTLHELADHLEELANLLRKLPDREIEGHSTGSFGRIGDRSNRVVLSDSRELLEELAGSLPNLEQDTAEEKVRSLTVPLIRELGKMLGVRIGSRASKQEAIRSLTWHLFESPSGHERIRSFHQRQANRREDQS